MHSSNYYNNCTRILCWISINKNIHTFNVIRDGRATYKINPMELLERFITYNTQVCMK